MADRDDLPLPERTGYRTPGIAGDSGTLPRAALGASGISGFGVTGVSEAVPDDIFPLTTGDLHARFSSVRLAAPGDTFMPLSWFLSRMPFERYDSKEAFLKRFLDRFPEMAPRRPKEGGPA